MTFLSKLDVQKTSYKLRVCIDDGSAIAFGEIASAVRHCLFFQCLKSSLCSTHKHYSNLRFNRCDMTCNENMFCRLSKKYSDFHR